ncbi:MAG: PEP/pyruvate-binding domain-containing protein [Thermomicrobiales bacterium]|nr:PEP/pyruvate-binding domain-containing protein [Thermomicrobiales bacterium]
MRYVEDIANLGMPDAEEAGGKGANMGEMVKAQLPVPPGFVVLRDSYLISMSSAGVSDELNAAHREAMLHAGDPGRFEEMCAKMKALVIKAGMADEVRERILTAYRAMGSNPYVAVRSSATGEDGADASFAGMNETFTNIRGEQDLIEGVQNCWASLFGPRVVAYRASRGFSADPAMAVVVQQMIRSDVSFIAFTQDPVGERRDHVVLSAAWGLGEALVSGLVTPDHLVVAPDGAVTEYVVGDKQVMVIPEASGSGTREAVVPRLMRTRPAVSAAQAAEIAALARGLAGRFGFAADLEGAIAAGQIVLFQARPITTLANVEAVELALVGD